MPRFGAEVLPQVEAYKQNERVAEDSPYPSS
jgi:hypothetical protein